MSSNSTGSGDAPGGGQVQGILDSLRPTLAILIALALGGVVALFAVVRTRPVSDSADVLRVEVGG